MDIYLPVANIVIDIFVLLALGSLSGFLSGLYGIGGGVIATPIMIFFGIPSHVVIGTASFQLLGSSIAGTIRNSIKRLIDFNATFIMFAGGFIGSTIGSILLNVLAKHSMEDFVVSIMFIMVMTTVLTPMCFEMIRAIFPKPTDNLRSARRLEIVARRRMISASDKPFMIYSSISQIEYNIFTMIFIGFIVGICSGLMGIGGGMISIPIMTYFLGIPFKVASSISLMQVALMSINNLAWQVKGGNVDVVLGFVLLMSSTFTVQLGSFAQSKLRSRVLKFTFALIIITILFFFLFRLYRQPSNLLMVG